MPHMIGSRLTPWKNDGEIPASEKPVFSLQLDLARAFVLTEKGDYEEAEIIQRNLLETYPGHPGLLTQLGQTLLWTGKLAEAGDCFEQASRINPMALAQMVNAMRFPEDPASIKVMCQIADNPLLDEHTRVTMAFALADLYGKLKAPDQAWPYLALANRLTDKTIKYDPEQFSRRVDLFQQIFHRDFFARQTPIRNSDRTPVFVVGMPRSGTTLTEQILCSHPDIFGAGELDLISRLVQLMPRVIQSGRSYPECMESFTPHLREEAARFYLFGLKHYDTEHPFVVDKMPHNFMQLGLISLIFPRAKIIHVQRDPRDTALSNFQQNFKAKHGGLGYAFNLEKTALQINDYHRMMAHWRKVLPIPMFEFFYEDLVSDQDTWSRKLLEFVGVEWDDKVHDFHKTERAVRTASVSQVRQPIYNTSKQKWRRYEKYLAPLLDSLDKSVTAIWISSLTIQKIHEEDENRLTLMFECSSAEIEHLLNRLREITVSHNAFFHQGITIHENGGNMYMSCTPPKLPGELLISMPESCLPPTEKFKLAVENDAIVIHGVSNGVPESHVRCFELMTEIFNHCGKLKSFSESSPWLALNAYPDFLRLLVQGREKALKVAGYTSLWEQGQLEKILLDGFVGSRYLSLNSRIYKESVLVFMPFIDYLNHHNQASGFQVARDSEPRSQVSTFNSQPLTGSGNALHAIPSLILLMPCSFTGLLMKAAVFAGPFR